MVSPSKKRRENRRSFPNMHYSSRKFRKTFVEKIAETVKKLKIDNPIIAVGDGLSKKKNLANEVVSRI